MKWAFLLVLSMTIPVMGAKKPFDGKSISINRGTFEFKDLKTSWWRAPVPADKQGISILFRAPLNKKKKFQPVLTVRTGKTEKNISSYVASWMNDYPKLGYDILGSRPFKYNNNLGYVVDVKNATSRKQARQVIFLKNNNTVILTCIDKINTFKGSLAECNKIVKSFTWITI